MSLRIESWRGTAFRNVPRGAGPLDITRAGLARGRWNLPGEPTHYLASSREVAAAEWLRHLEDAGLSAGVPVPGRDLYEVALSLKRIIDFRDGANQAQLAIDDMSKLVLDPFAARALATFVRSALEAEAIWVPSVAFLDRRDQGNLVIFLERLHAPLKDLATARLVGKLTLP